MANNFNEGIQLNLSQKEFELKSNSLNNAQIFQIEQILKKFGSNDIKNNLKLIIYEIVDQLVTDLQKQNKGQIEIIKKQSLLEDKLYSKITELKDNLRLYKIKEENNLKATELEMQATKKTLIEMDKKISNQQNIAQSCQQYMNQIQDQFYSFFNDIFLNCQLEDSHKNNKEDLELFSEKAIAQKKNSILQNINRIHEFTKKLKFNLDHAKDKEYQLSHENAELLNQLNGKEQQMQELQLKLCNCQRKEMLQNKEFNEQFEQLKLKDIKIKNLQETLKIQQNCQSEMNIRLKDLDKLLIESRSSCYQCKTELNNEIQNLNKELSFFKKSKEEDELQIKQLLEEVRIKNNLNQQFEEQIFINDKKLKEMDLNNQENKKEIESLQRQKIIIENEIKKLLNDLNEEKQQNEEEIAKLKEQNSIELMQIRVENKNNILNLQEKFFEAQQQLKDMQVDFKKQSTLLEQSRIEKVSTQMNLELKNQEIKELQEQLLKNNIGITQIPLYCKKLESLEAKLQLIKSRQLVKIKEETEKLKKNLCDKILEERQHQLVNILKFVSTIEDIQLKKQSLEQQLQHIKNYNNLLENKQKKISNLREQNHSLKTQLYTAQKKKSGFCKKVKHNYQSYAQLKIIPQTNDLHRSVSMSLQSIPEIRSYSLAQMKCSNQQHSFKKQKQIQQKKNQMQKEKIKEFLKTEENEEDKLNNLYLRRFQTNNI